LTGWSDLKNSKTGRKLRRRGIGQNVRRQFIVPPVNTSSGEGRQKAWMPPGATEASHVPAQKAGLELEAFWEKFLAQANLA